MILLKTSTWRQAAHSRTPVLYCSFRAVLLKSFVLPLTDRKSTTHHTPLLTSFFGKCHLNEIMYVWNFKVLKAVTMKNTVLWCVTPRRLVKYIEISEKSVAYSFLDENYVENVGIRFFWNVRKNFDILQGDM